MGMGDLDGQTQLVPQLVEVGALIARGLDVHAHVRMRHFVMLQEVGAEERPVRPLLLVVAVAAGTLPGRRMVVGRVAMLMGRMGVLGILLGVVPLAGIDMRVSVVELGVGVHSTLLRAVHLVAGLRAQLVVGQLGIVAPGVPDAVVAVQPERRIGGVVVVSDPDAVVVAVVRQHRVGEQQLLGAAARFVPGQARAARVEPELRVALDPHRLVERHLDPDPLAPAVGVPVQARTRGHRDPLDPRRAARRHRQGRREALACAGAARAQFKRVLRPVGEPRHRGPGRVGLARPAVRNQPPVLVGPARLVPVLVVRDARIRRRRVPGERHPRVAGRGPEIGRRRQRRRLRKDGRRQARRGAGERVALVTRGQRRLVGQVDVHGHRRRRPGRAGHDERRAVHRARRHTERRRAAGERPAHQRHRNVHRERRPREHLRPHPVGPRLLHRHRERQHIASVVGLPFRTRFVSPVRPENSPSGSEVRGCRSDKAVQRRQAQNTSSGARSERCCPARVSPASTARRTPPREP